MTLKEKTKTVIIDFAVENRRRYIIIKFPYDNELINIARNLAGCHWNNLKKVWQTPWHASSLNEVKLAFGLVAIVDDSLLQEKQLRWESFDKYNAHLNGESILKIEKFKRWLLSKRYSDNTIEVYIEALVTSISAQNFLGLRKAFPTR